MNKNQLKKQLLHKELQIKKLGINSHSSEVCEQLYNSLILEKAILKKEMDDLEKNKVLDSLKSLFKPKQKLICDYWKK